MADPTRRLNRMLDLLPRIFVTQPADSAIGLVLRRAATALAELDLAQRRVLHDSWLQLATGTAAGPEVPSALERLGGLLDTPRLPAESAEAYRARLSLTARVLMGGLATPKAILSLALADLGTEACPRMDTALIPRDTPDTPWAVEATTAWGMPLGTRRRCPVCAGTVAGPCPNRERRLVDAWLAENPVTPAERNLEAAYWVPFPVESRSLVADRPVLRLRPIGQARLSYPAVQNRATGEITLFAGMLLPGETLTLEPALTPAERRPFDAFDAREHHGWTATHPAGRAAVSRTDGSARDVSDSIFFLSGSPFNDVHSTYAGLPPTGNAAAEEGTRLAVLEQGVRTPLLRPGTNSWRLLQFALPESRFDDPADPPTFAGDTAIEGTRFALWDAALSITDARQSNQLFQALAAAEASARGMPPGPPVAVLELDWLTRPPATFRVTVLRSAQLDLAEAQGGLDLLRRDLEMARPAGIRALLDIRPPPIPRENAGIEEGGLMLGPALGWTEPVPLAEGGLTITLGTTLRDTQPFDDARLAWDGIFNTTRLNATRLV
ncbi:MAG: hypothetical protein ACOYOH_26605 [Paracraurococcus sp.]